MKVLFLTPFSGTWAHSLPEALVASALQEQGHSVVFVGCGRELSSYCINMAARRVRHDQAATHREDICRDCELSSRLLRDHFQLRGPTLKSLVTDPERKEARAIAHRSDPETYLSVEVDGIPVGRAAVYETIIHNKKVDARLTLSEWRQVQDSLENTILSLRAAQRAFAEHKPDAFCVYASLYSTNHVWKLWAERCGITPYLIQGGPNFEKMRQTLILVRDTSPHGISYFGEAMSAWAQYKALPASHEGIALTVAHLRKMFRGGAFVFGAAKKGKSPRRHWRIPDGKKLVVAALSSFDEVLAAEVAGYPQFTEKRAFATREEWVEELIRFARARPDLSLIVRPHPREFAKDNPVVSESALRVQELFADLPENVIVNLPQDGFSIYDLFEECDLLLNGWSTTGSEAPLFGIPVVSYMEMSWYPSDLNFIGDTRERYFSVIDDALRSGWSTERIVLAFRWFSLLYHWGVLDLSGVILKDEPTGRERVAATLLDPFSLVEKFVEKTRRSGVYFAARKHRDLRHSGKTGPRFLREVNQVFERQLPGIAALRLEEARRQDPASEAAAIKSGLRELLEEIEKFSPLQGDTIRKLAEFARS